MEQFLKELSTLAGVLLAIVLGFAIGFERKLRFKEAGIRTHTIVCMGAALMMVVSKYGFSDVQADGARVAAQIVSGIGFLGAGIIMFRGQKIHGITTAAGVWATAGVGMAAGAGMHVVATGATLLLIIVQCICHIDKGPFKTKKYYRVTIGFTITSDESVRVKQIFEVDHFSQLKIERRADSCETVYRASLNTDKEYASQTLNTIMAENPFIISIERCDDN